MLWVLLNAYPPIRDSLGEDVNNMSTFEYYWNWFQSLYHIEWNFFGFEVTLIDCVVGVGVFFLAIDCIKKFFVDSGMSRYYDLTDIDDRL